MDSTAVTGTRMEIPEREFDLDRVVDGLEGQANAESRLFRV